MTRPLGRGALDPRRAGVALLLASVVSPGWSLASLPAVAGSHEPAATATDEPVVTETEPPATTATPPNAYVLPMRAVDDPLFGIVSVAPQDWQSLGQGIHARGTPPSDPTLLALQSAKAANAEIWPLLLTTLALDAVPQPTGSRTTEAFGWTLYDVTVGSGPLSLAVSLALAERDGTSYAVLLQSRPDEGEAIARASGLPEEEVEAARAFAKASMPLALAGDEARLREVAEEHFGAFWDRQPSEAQAVLGERPAFVKRQVDAQVPTLLSEWFRSFLASDPAADWARVTVPALAIFGALDVQVPAEPNEPAWREAVTANPDATSVVLDDANHLFQAAKTGAIGEYAQLEPSFSADFLPTLTDWVVEHTLR